MKKVKMFSLFCINLSYISAVFKLKKGKIEERIVIITVTFTFLRQY